MNNTSRRQERRRGGITARQQRIRKRRLFGVTDKIKARRYRRLMQELFGYGPGCQVREHHNVMVLTRATKRFIKYYVEAAA